MAQVLAEFLLALTEIPAAVELGAEQCNDAVHDDGAEWSLVGIGQQRSDGLDDLHLLLVRKHAAHDDVVQRLLDIQPEARRDCLDAFRTEVALCVNVDCLALSATGLESQLRSDAERVCLHVTGKQRQLG